MSEFRQGKGDTLTKFQREGDVVTITSRRLGYPVKVIITPELLEFLAIKGEQQ